MFQPVVAAGGRLRRMLSNSSAQSLGLFVIAVTGAWWWLSDGAARLPPDVRSSGPTRAEVKPDELPPRPSDLPKAEPVTLPDATPPRPETSPETRPPATRPATRPDERPSLVSSKGQVREAPPPGSTLRQAAYAPSAGPTGGVSYRTPTIQGWEVVAYGDLERTIKPTTDIPCTLNGAIDGTHPGEFTCIIARDIFGWALPPRIALLKAGDTVTGTYRPLATGEGRILGLSAFAFTTVGDKGLQVPLGGAPVEDSIGRAGMGGHVESRFWERLGNAIITDGSAQAARLPADALRNASAGVQINTDTTEGIVQDTLRSQGNAIRPLFRKNEGDTINIRVTQAIHFGVLQYEAAR